MKKRIIPILLSLILLSCNNSSNKTEPSLISFEAQEVLSSYNFNFISSAGKTSNLVAKKNNVLFIHYWNPTHEKALEDLKSIQKLYDAYKFKVEFYLITDISNKSATKFLKENHILFPSYYIGATPPKPFTFKKDSPKTYLISKKGRIIINQEGIVNWESAQLRKTIDGLIK